MKVLIVKMSSMGDVIHTLPAVTDALKARPDLIVDWCVEAAFAPLVRLHPGIRRIHEISLRSWRKAPFSAASWRGARALLRDLRAERYDLVIDAQGLLKSAVVASLVGVPISGLDAASAREPMATRVYRHRHAVSRKLHAIERVRLLFGHALNYRPDINTIDYGIASVTSVATKSVLMLHGTSWSSKRWSTKNWTELARKLIDLGYSPQVTYENKAEEAVAHAIAVGAPGTELLPRAPLDEVAAVIGRATAVVGCDSGLTHLAAALERPTIALFFSTKPDLTGVAGRRARTLEASIDCAPCNRRRCPLVSQEELRPCLHTLSPSFVVENIANMIEGFDPIGSSSTELDGKLPTSVARQPGSDRKHHAAVPTGEIAQAHYSDARGTSLRSPDCRTLICTGAGIAPKSEAKSTRLEVVGPAGLEPATRPL